MRFIDEAKIEIAAGSGGPGSISFRREKFIPKGGPDGGDGGDGGSVIFISTDQLGTLQDFRYKRSYAAQGGGHGRSSMKAGKDGLNLEIRVPVGTLIKEAETGILLHDFSSPNEQWVACKGGKGGKGNTHFATSTHQAPRFAQPGETGEKKSLHLELKLLADVGIVGYPNAGKSTLISTLSNARPKIADYPFTTLVPNLGVVALDLERSFVVADVPGLIEGAHKGAGLGHQFLKHLERTRVLLHLLDVFDPEIPSDDERWIPTLVARYTTIRRELKLFNAELAEKPELLAFTKKDLSAVTDEQAQALEATLREHGFRGDRFYWISSIAREGLTPLTEAIWSIVRESLPPRH